MQRYQHTNTPQTSIKRWFGWSSRNILRSILCLPMWKWGIHYPLTLSQMFCRFYVC